MGAVAIVGAGVMGTALCYPLSDNGHDVRLVGTHLDDDIIRSCQERRYHPRLGRELPPSVRPYFVHQMAEALSGVEMIVSGVNSFGVEWLGRAIAPYLRPGQPIPAVTKGLAVAEDGDLRILPDVLADQLPEPIRGQVHLAAIGGPCIAGELAGRRPSCVVFGSRHPDVAERLAALFRTPTYHISTTADLAGLELCAALKNAYTIGVGAVAGMLERSGGPDPAGAYLHNLAAAVFAQACREMDRVLQLAGCTRALAYGLPGAGDLYVTCQRGRSLRTGQLLGLGHTLAEVRQLMAGETLEAVACVGVMGEALPKLTARGAIGKEELPLMRALVDTVVHDAPIEFRLGTFFR